MTVTSTSTNIGDLPTIFRVTQPPVDRRLHEPRPVYETRLDSDVGAETNLILRNLFGYSVSQTSLEPTKLDRQRIILWLHLTSWLGSAVWRESSTWRSEADLPQQQQLAIEQTIVAEYAAIPQVALIYSDRYLDEHVFTMFITGHQYDDAVMDALLDREMSLLNRFAPRPMTFYYLPYPPHSPRREMVRETARLIFEG